MATPTKVWTWQEALELPGGDRYEVINGELKERTMSFESSAIAGLFIELLRGWARRTKAGFVAGPDGGLAIFSWMPGDVRMPDVTYVSRERVARLPRRGWLTVAPELAIEVISPNDRIEDAEDKARDYIRAGVDLVWVVIPSTRSVHVWRTDGSRVVLQPGEVLSGEAVLPGFELPVAEIFAEFEEPGL